MLHVLRSTCYVLHATGDSADLRFSATLLLRIHSQSFLESAATQRSPISLSFFIEDRFYLGLGSGISDPLPSYTVGLNCTCKP